jgi:hypothetical protein
VRYFDTTLYLCLGPLTNNAGDFIAWEKIPLSLRTVFSKQTNESLAKYPADWPEIVVSKSWAFGWLDADTKSRLDHTLSIFCR